VIAYFLRTVRLGLKSLTLHKLRSSLAMLGILIGVMAVIWLVALGEGVSYQAQEQIKELGATNIIVKSVKPAQGSSAGSSMIVEYGLTRADYQRLLDGVPTIRRAVPMREVGTIGRNGGREADIKLLGCTPAYLDINRLRVSSGRFLEDADIEHSDNVCVLGSAAAENLFKYEDPLGRNVELHFNFTFAIFRVIGVTASRDPSASIGGSLEGRDFNSDVYIPFSTFRERVGDQVITTRSGTSREGELVQLSQITISVGNINEVEEAAGIIRYLIGRSHRVVDYSVTVPKELLRQAEMLRMLFNVMLVVIAGISLLVGGIGIMNIMLATVTERTREIGIRRAIGARRTDIIYQFLSETIVLSGTGGLAGIAGGFLIHPVIFTQVVAGVRWVMEEGLPALGVDRFAGVWSSLPPTIQNLQPIVAPWSIAVAFGISVCVGVLFGLYPARRAAMMDPIEALRHE
jgi:putative ABC transport system permease protein